tara:strand:- start:4950 stop:5069 length:120 start_codon:yes stop_codon:yes gene_type:complete
MTTSFLYDLQIEETPEFWTDEMIQEYMESQEDEEYCYFD